MSGPCCANPFPVALSFRHSGAKPNEQRLRTATARTLVRLLGQLQLFVIWDHVHGREYLPPNLAGAQHSRISSTWYIPHCHNFEPFETDTTAKCDARSIQSKNTQRIASSTHSVLARQGLKSSI
jgi:hypothetical protein